MIRRFKRIRCHALLILVAFGLSAVEAAAYGIYSELQHSQVTELPSSPTVEQTDADDALQPDAFLFALMQNCRDLRAGRVADASTEFKDTPLRPPKS